jgi:hypothetical protein
MAVGVAFKQCLRYSRSRRESEPADEGTLSPQLKDTCLELLGDYFVGLGVQC